MNVKKKLRYIISYFIFITLYIINLQLSSTNIIYNSFDNFLKVVNTYATAKKYVFAIKYSKILKKELLCKFWFKNDKNGFYKAKKYKIQ